MTTQYQIVEYAKVEDIPAYHDPRFPPKFVERLWKARNFIEDSPEHNFDMSDWGEIDADLKSEHCGSPACLAGFISVLAFKGPDGPRITIHDCCSRASIDYLGQYHDPDNKEHNNLMFNLDRLYLTVGPIMDQAKKLPLFEEDSNLSYWSMSEIKKNHILAILDGILDQTIDPFEED